VGAEVEIAADACIPIMLFALDGVPMSRMTPGTHGRIDKVIPFAHFRDLSARFAGEIENAKLTALRLRLKKATAGIDFPKLLRRLREARGIATSTVATEVGISEWFLKDLETLPLSESNPSYLTLRSLSAYFGFDVATLVSEASVTYHLTPEPLRWMFEIFHDRNLPVPDLAGFFEAYSGMDFRGEKPRSKAEVAKLLDSWLETRGS
jgi:transcriptional regulator with XRE-family HTH domain